MKKILAKLAVIFSCSLLFGASFDYYLILPQIFTAREISLGANYNSDYSTVISVFANPASSGLTGNKKLFPFISVDVSGNLAGSYDLLNNVSGKDATAIQTYTDSIDNIRTNTKITGPLAFGGVKNNFSFAFLDTMYMNSDIYSNDKDSEVFGGEQMYLHLAYAYPIKLPKNTKISIGLGLHGFSDFQGYYKGPISDALIYMSANQMGFFPMFATFGFGLDAGVTFAICDLVDVGFSWIDFFGAAITQKYDSMNDFKRIQSAYEMQSKMPLDSNLSAGFTVKLPLDEPTMHFLTKSNIYFQFSNLLPCLQGLDTDFVKTISLGAELEMFNTLTFRIGANSNYLSGGIGFKNDIIHIDASFYSTKFGLTPNASGDMGFSLSFGVYN